MLWTDAAQWLRNRPRGCARRVVETAGGGAPASTRCIPTMFAVRKTSVSAADSDMNTMSARTEREARPVTPSRTFPPPPLRMSRYTTAAVMPISPSSAAAAVMLTPVPILHVQRCTHSVGWFSSAVSCTGYPAPAAAAHRS